MQQVRWLGNVLKVVVVSGSARDAECARAGRLVGSRFDLKTKAAPDSATKTIAALSRAANFRSEQ